MSGHEPELLPSETLQRLVQLLSAYEAAPVAMHETETHETAESRGCIRQHMLLGFQCEFLDMLRGEEGRLSPELQARLAGLRQAHEQYTATAVVDRYACVHMIQLYHDLRAQHRKHETLCAELAEYDAELVDLTAQRDALRAECEGVRAECERQQALARDAEQRLADMRAEAQQQRRVLNKGRQDQTKVDKALAEQQKRKEGLGVEIDSLCTQRDSEKALLCHEQGLPGLEKAVHDLEELLKNTPLHMMMMCQELNGIDGFALDP